MPYNEVLLLKPVDGLGGEGDQVRVRAGYARNYLFPQKIGVPLTQSNRKQIESLKRRRAERESEEVAGAKALAQRLEKVGSLAFAVKTGEGGRMFGSITAGDIHEKLEAAGVPIDRKKIHLYTPARALGRHTIKIKLHEEVSVELAFDIVSENPIEAPAEEKKPAPKRSEARK